MIKASQNFKKRTYAVSSAIWDHLSQIFKFCKT